jgi:hypothetical protein
LASYCQHEKKLSSQPTLKPAEIAELRQEYQSRKIAPIEEEEKIVCSLKEITEHIDLKTDYFIISLNQDFKYQEHKIK